MSTQIQRRRGTTAEHSTFTGVEGELTVDTTKDTVVVHDGATTGGHPLQKQYPPLGSAAAPTYTFTGDTNTGIYSPGADQVAISTNGTGRLFVDASGRIGLGTSSPAVPLDIATINSTANLRITDSTNGARIKLVTASTEVDLFNTGGAGWLGTATNSPLLLVTNNTEKLRITSDGKVGLGTSSPSFPLHVVTSGNSGLAVYTGTSGANQIYLGNTGGESVVGTLSNQNFGIIANGGQKVTVTTGGLVGVGTTSVNAKFQVSGGNIRLDNNQGVEWGGSNNYIYGNETTDFVAVATNGNECSRWDSSGRLLVGTSSDIGNSSKVQIRGGNLNIYHADSATNAGYGIHFSTDGGATARSKARISLLQTAANGGTLTFSTTLDGSASPTEMLRLDSVGSLSSRRYISNSPGGDYWKFNQSATGSSGAATLSLYASASDQRYHVAFFTGGSVVGSISSTSGGTTFATSSDYRLKENVTAVTDGITRLQQLKPSRFNFIADPDKTVDGFLAHEVQAIVPEAITGEKDAVDADGNPEYQGIDQSKLVPLLTAALQEAVAKIESLEARLTAAGI